VLTETTLTPHEWAQKGLHVNHDGLRRSAADLLGSPGVELADLIAGVPALAGFSSEILMRCKATGLGRIAE
jgi:tRNA uridine 5-carboxymethylaminomethyl modification enzyme